MTKSYIRPITHILFQESEDLMNIHSNVIPQYNPNDQLGKQDSEQPDTPLSIWEE